MAAETETDYLRNESQSSWPTWYFITLLSNVDHYVLKNFLSCEDTGLSSIIRFKPLFGICLHDFNVIHINGSLPVQLIANDTQGKSYITKYKSTETNNWKYACLLQWKSSYNDNDS
jgi:hypothetical protein